MSLCQFCHGESIKDIKMGNEIFCRYKCYDKMYSLEEEEEEEEEELQ
jgi:hypothetical protein